MRSRRHFLSVRRSDGKEETGGEEGARTHLSLERELQGEKQNHKYVSVRRRDFHGRAAEQLFQSTQTGVSLPSAALIFCAAASKQDELVELEGGRRAIVEFRQERRVTLVFIQSQSTFFHSNVKIIGFVC